MPRSPSTEAAARVRAVRAYRDMTQAQLAEKLGVSVATMKRIEDGARPMSTDDLLNVAIACDFPAAFLLRGLDAFNNVPDMAKLATELNEQLAQLSDLKNRLSNASSSIEDSLQAEG